MTKNVTAAIGLGGNLGNPKEQMKEALSVISSSKSVQIEQVSLLYKTAPWGNTDQPSFLNACALLRTELPASKLLELCLKIETDLGRVRFERWGPRAIDLDVLYYDDQVIDHEGLQLPHPRMTQRAFVMVPLADISPDKIIEGKNVEKWASELILDDIEISDHSKNWWLEV